MSAGLSVGGTLGGVEEEQRRWSAAANRLGDSLDRWRGMVLLLAVLGVVFATVAAELASVAGVAARGVSLLSGVVLALIGVIQTRALSPAARERWTRARATAERLGSQIYLYRVGAPPYAGEQRDATLGAVYDEVIASVYDLLPLVETQEPEADLFAPVRDVHSYIEVRLFDQISREVRPDGKARGYYRRAALAAQERLSRLRRAELALTTVGAALGVAGAAVAAGRVSIWIGVVTTLGGAISTHVTASRYEFQATTYLATARKLEALLRDWRLETDGHPEAESAAGQALVRACENVIERENAGWIVEWTRAGDLTPGDTAPPGPPGQRVATG